MNIRTISKSEFDLIDPSRKVIIHDNPQKFALLDLGEPWGCYGINWRSDSIEPVIQLSTDKLTLWIGIDQRLAAIDLQQGNICISLPPIMPIIDIAIADNFAAILTEMEVFLFTPNRTLACFQFLPDMTSNISVFGANFTIEMFDGSSYRLTRSGLLEETSKVPAY